MTTRSQAAVGAAAGLLATLAGTAAGHLAAALTDPAASPPLAVGSAVVDLTPTPAKEWAIVTFGNADKAVLVGSVLAVVLLLSLGVGIVARRRPARGAALLLAVVAVAGGAALSRPTAGIEAVLPSGVAAVVGVGVLLLLTWAGRHGGSRGEIPARRAFLLAAGVTALGAAGMTSLARRVISVRTRPGDVVLPAAARPAPRLSRGLEAQVPGISPLRTPTADFYRVDTRLALPLIDADSWTLTIDGDVRREVTFTFEELLSMPLVERDITLTCVSNAVGGEYVGAARWLGVPLRDLLALAGVGTRADQILSTDVDGMTISTPLDLATDGRDALLAVGMNGEPLPREHGFPARLVVAGLYGFIGATKWVSRLTLTTYAEQTAYWTDRDWATDAPIKTSSRIDTPRPLAELEPGRRLIGGVAWAQAAGGVRAVQVRVDGGPWRDAQLGPDVGEGYWRQWFLPWTAEPGGHRLACRAVDASGRTQTAVRAEPFPAGSSGVHELLVTVKGS